QDYRQTHPEVPVLDPRDAIQHLHNRQSMLQCVAEMNLCDFLNFSAIYLDALSKGSKFPPQVELSHFLVLDLSVAYDSNSSDAEHVLIKMHFAGKVGGVLFKVYIVGEAIKVLGCFSLPDVTKQELCKNAGLFRFPPVSAAASADDADLDPSVAG
ncbi:LOW QUALITY PROTEIN: Ins134_P3_kin domain-containing protein, partial [Cephalotus follicularis]